MRVRPSGYSHPHDDTNPRPESIRRLRGYPGRRRPSVEALERRTLLTTAYFEPEVLYPGGSGFPSPLTQSDFDDDGDLDLAILGVNANNFSVLLNQGDGTFGVPLIYPAGFYPAGIVAGRFDGDDAVDLIVCDLNTSAIDLYRGEGDGTFHVDLQHPIPVGPSPTRMVAGDLNLDGHLDLAILCLGGVEPQFPRINILLGRGDGTFASAPDAFAGFGPADFAAADLDADGDLDLAISDQMEDKLKVLLNKGDGTFFGLTPYPVGADPFMVIAEDLDGDEVIDLAATNWGGHTISVLSGRGDGTFRPARDFEVGNKPFSLVAADFDHDGRMDLAVAAPEATPENGTVHLLLGADDGFDAPRGVEPVTKPGSLVAGDFDADGRVDLATSHYGTGLGVLINSGLFHLPTLSVDDTEVVEGGAGESEAVFVVRLSEAFEEEVTVDYAVSVGTADRFSDLSSLPSGTLIFAPGETIREVRVAVRGDLVPEADETFFIDLTRPSLADIVDGRAVGTIVNDDTALGFREVNVSVFEGDAGTVEAVFEVYLTRPIDRPVTLTYSTVDGSADGTDYARVEGVPLTFSPGETSRTVRVAVFGDTAIELHESFSLRLSDVVGAIVEQAQATGTIVNDDTGASVHDAEVDEGDSGVSSYLRFPVVLAAQSARFVEVAYAVSDGTAGAGTDYTPTTGMLVVAPGETVGYILVPVLGDRVDEADETVRVEITGISGATVAAGWAIGTIRDDDPTPKVSILDSQIREGNSGTSVATILVGLSSAADRPVSVTYRAVGGTAAAGADFADPGVATLTFEPGQTRLSFAIAVLGDRSDEADETIILALSDPTGGAAIDGAGTAVLTVRDDDSPGGPVGDYDGDGISDPVVFEPSTSTFYLALSALGNRSLQFGIGSLFGGSPVPVPADYDGDGKLDPAVFEPSTATFYLARSSAGNVSRQFGIGALYGGSPVPVVADYDGDGKADPAVFEPSTSTFYLARTSLGNTARQFGIGSLYGGSPAPVPGDYDGDGKADPAVFEPSTSTFYLTRSSAGNAARQFGIGLNFGGSPMPVPADYDGDGKLDPAVFEPSTATFYLARSSAGNRAVQFGIGTRFGGTPTPIPGDYDGDGLADAAVFEPSTSTFYVAGSSAGNAARQFGIGHTFGGSPTPVVADYDGDGKADPAVFEPSTSTFYLARSSAGNMLRQFGIGALYGGSPVPLPQPPHFRGIKRRP